MSNDEESARDSADEKARAVADLEAITKLRVSQAFNEYYLRRLGEKIQARRDKMLHPHTSDADMALEKKIILAMESDLAFMTEDEIGARNVLG